jgi:tyrosine-protein kinase Etk/Wzc
VEKKNKEQNNNQSSGLTVIEIIIIFLSNRRKIFIITGIFCIISIILYFFVFDLIYYSSATIKSSNKSSSLLSSISENIPDFADLDALSIGGKSAKELAAYEEILKSRRCIEPLIDKFKIMDDEEFKYKEDAIKEFRDNKLNINFAKLSGTMEVGVYYKNPVIAKEMVEFLLSELDKINIEMNVLNAKNNRQFIENRYNQAREDLTRSEDSLKSFQLIYGISPDLQFKAAAQSQFTLEAELKAEEVKLDILKKILSPEQTEVKTQEAKINSLKNKVEEIKNSTNLDDMLRLGNSPEILMSFLRHTREVEIQSKIVAFLLPIYEQSKIEEKRETPTVLILDKPYAAERKSKPKRLTMVLIFTFVGFAFASSIVVILHKWKSFKKSEDFQKIKSS